MTNNLLIVLPSVFIAIAIVVGVIWLIIKIKKKSKTERQGIVDRLKKPKNFYEKHKPISFKKWSLTPSGIVLAAGIKKKDNTIDNSSVVNNLTKTTSTTKIPLNNLCVSVSKQLSAAVIAPPGSGKTQALLFPTILFNAYSKDKPWMIITDPKSEVLSGVSGVLKQNGYETITISTFERLSKNKKGYITDFWNPLDTIIELHKKLLMEKNVFESQDITSKLQKEINFIIESFDTSVKEKNEIWQKNGVKIAKAMIAALLYKVETKEIDYSQVNLTNAWQNIYSNPDSFLTWAREIKTNINKYDSKTLKIVVDYLDWTNERTENVNSFITNATTMLGIFNSSYMKCLTSKTTFDINQLIDSNKPVAIFITLNTSALADESELMLSRVYMKLINKKISEYKSTHNDGFSKRCVYWLIDECGNIPYMDFLENIVNAGRGQKMFAMPIFQNETQLVKKYPYLLDSCEYRILFNNDNHLMANRVSQLTGLDSDEDIESANNKRPSNILRLSEVANIPLGYLGLWTFKRDEKDDLFYYLPTVYFYMLKNIPTPLNERINLKYLSDSITQKINFDLKTFSKNSDQQTIKIWDFLRIPLSCFLYETLQPAKNELNNIKGILMKWTNARFIDIKKEPFSKEYKSLQEIKEKLIKLASEYNQKLPEDNILDVFEKINNENEINIFYNNSYLINESLKSSNK